MVNILILQKHIQQIIQFVIKDTVIKYCSMDADI